MGTWKTFTNRGFSRAKKSGKSASGGRVYRVSGSSSPTAGHLPELVVLFSPQFLSSKTMQIFTLLLKDAKYDSLKTDERSSQSRR